MAQFKKISLVILILTTVACIVTAEPPRHRQRLAGRKLQPLRQRSKVHQQHVSARQEAVTPYPTADELKPEVPFEEGNQPDEVYGPPDETYGPPELDQTPADQLPSEELPEEFAPNPDAEEFQPAAEEQASRLTSRRKSNKNKKRIASRLVQKKNSQKSQRLVLAPVTAGVPVALPFTSPYAAQSQQYFLLNQPFAYTTHYQAW